MNIGVLWCVAVLVIGSNAEGWRWPDSTGSPSVRIDTKIGFIDQGEPSKKNSHENRQDDELPFQEPLDTEGFYNRPPGNGRFPVRVEGHQQQQQYRVDGQGIYPLRNDQKNQNYATQQQFDGTLDSLHYCKCVTTVTSPECNPRPNSEAACGAGRFLCCYRRPNKANTEYFNEVEDQRPMLLPGQETLARPFPPPAPSGFLGSFGPGHSYENSVVGVYEKPHQQQQQHPGVLVGPGGPTGNIGPQQKPEVLVGPGGPTGQIGPVGDKDDARRSESAQRGVLVGPGGPTGIIGPAYDRRPILVGPGGPTGIIGPGRGGRGPGILVGPGGPTGIIGPGYGRRSNGILTGPDGPTGIIGPVRRPVLVGPDGPTGQIGPLGYYG